jgi:hypothetical protein
MRKGLFIKYLEFIIGLGCLWILGSGSSFCQNLPPVFSPFPNCFVSQPDSDQLQLSGDASGAAGAGGGWEGDTYTTCWVAEKETLELDVHATDPEGEAVHLSVENAPSTASFSDLGNGAARLLWVPDYLGPLSVEGSPFVLYLVARDDSSETRMMVKIHVTNVNRPPELFAPDSLEGVAGSPVVFQIKAMDLDSEQVNLQLVNPPSGMNYDGVTGIFNWTPQLSDTGLWVIESEATDQSGGETSAETRIHVLAPSVFNLSLEVKEAILGTTVEVPVKLANSDPVAGMELCIKFDPYEFTFLGVSRQGCRTEGWEYFTFKEKVLSQFNVVKIVGIADFPNQVSTLPLLPDSGTIVKLNFQLTSDPYLNGFLLPLEFCSVNFADNTLSTSRGRFITRAEINATNGGVLLNSTQTLIGDINLNGLAFEVGDAVSLALYLSGKKVLSQQQLINSDVNQDGKMGTLADLVFLIRHIIEGGHAPDGQDVEGGQPALVSITSEEQKTTLGIDSPSAVGGAVVILKGENLKEENVKLSPEAAGLDLYTSRTENELKVMVIGQSAQTLPSGNQPLFCYEGGGVDSVQVSLADADGKLMKVDQKQSNNSQPTRYALYQNYPNPFNPETQIKYSVSGDGLTHVSLRIYNVVGQLVKTLVDEEQMPGEYTHTWNGKDEKNQDVASGMYFYKLRVSDFSETKKMVLLR